jgi:hypothetical protein
MQSPPVSYAEIDARLGSHIDELLELWWAEQGASKPKDLELIALATGKARRERSEGRWLARRASGQLRCRGDSERFWSRANALLGYDHTTLLGPRHAHRIGDDGMSVAGWMRLLERAGFELKMCS